MFLIFTYTCTCNLHIFMHLLRWTSTSNVWQVYLKSFQNVCRLAFCHNHRSNNYVKLRFYYKLRSSTVWTKYMTKQKHTFQLSDTFLRLSKDIYYVPFTKKIFSQTMYNKGCILYCTCYCFSKFSSRWSLTFKFLLFCGHWCPL